jgi:hypothetical protein
MRAAAALLLVCAAAGCRATPGVSSDDLAVDDLGAGGGDDLAGADFSVADMACAVGPEVCGNGCDDDRNGYTDADDPACTSQMLVTLSMGTPALWRLVLEPTPHVAVLDGNPITTNGAMAAYNASFAPAAFVAYEGATRQLDRLPIGGGAKTTATTTYGMRDACVFNGELIVVEPKNFGTSAGVLHRFKADGMTELGSLPVVDVASACSSDGNALYVAHHTATGPSQIRVYSKSASGPVDTNVDIAMPDALLNAGYDRIVDLVYVKKGALFIGLFAMSNGAPADSSLNGDVMAPFGFDGGVGDFIDGGVWHGVGEFLP